MRLTRGEKSLTARSTYNEAFSVPILRMKMTNLVAGVKTMKNNALEAKISEIVAGTQISLFHVEKQVEYDGIVMEK